MKRFLAIAAFLLIPLFASNADTDPALDYIAKFSKTARSEMQRTGVPASITLAQGIVESNSGRSTLARQGNNHFGIKCHKTWKGKRIYHDDDAKGECFRVYGSASESYRDHSNFLRYSDRYKFLFDYKKTDYKSWAYGLKKAGYATDPKYAQKLIAVVEKYNLGRYDHGIVVPETPEKLEAPKRVVVRDDSRFSEKVEMNPGRPMYEVNGVPFVYAFEGETYESIALMYNLFAKEIRHFNDAPAGSQPLPGDKVYVEHKKARAAVGVESFFVEDETLREVAQRFGVREADIVKLNKFPKDYVPQKGDEIKLR